MVLLVGALLAWFAVGLAAPLRERPLPASAAATFVPDDGYRYSARLSARGRVGPAMVESARITGQLITFAMSPTALRYLEEPAEGLRAAAWWREGVVPGDLSQATRYRLRSVGPEGVFLRVQEWETLGVSFERLLELPADVRAGQIWSSNGQALAAPLDAPLTFRNTSSAAEPTDPVRAAQGCLTVDSRTEVSSGTGAERWQESSVWCPGQGVVESSGTQRGARYAVGPAPSGPVTAEILAPATFDPAGRAGWVHQRERVIAGDETFGDEEADLRPGGPPVVAANGLVVFSSGGIPDLVGLLPLTSGPLWAHWRVRPGGQVASAASVGSLVVVGTTQRQLLGYGAGGRHRWTVELDDVAVTPPLPVGPDRLAVATVGGSLMLVDSTDGKVVWTRRIRAGVHNPLATNGQVVVTVDTRRVATAWDVGSGRRLWSSDGASPYGSELALDAESVYLASGGSVVAQDSDTGAQRWRRYLGLGLGRVARTGDLLLVENGGGVEAWSPGDGRQRWRVPGAELARGSSGCLPPATTGGPTAQPVILLAADRLLTADSSGRTLQTWPIAAPPTAVRTLHCAADRIWVTSHDANGNQGLRVESVGPR